MKQKMMWMSAMAAGIALFCVSGSLLGNSSTILLVNDVVVDQKALLIENQEAILPASYMGQARSLPIYVPMKLDIDEGIIQKHHTIEVNVGTLVQVLDDNMYSDETTKLVLTEDAEFYWILDSELDMIQAYTIEHAGTDQETIGFFYMEESDKKLCPACTITSGLKTEIYTLEFCLDTQSYSIRKTK